MTFKPMLAAAVEWDKVDFSTMKLRASRKLDGIRALVSNGVVLSRSLKPIPNKFVQERFGKPEYEGLDGELIVGAPNAKDVYRVTNSAVMSYEGEPDVKFHAFDYYLFHDRDYSERLMILATKCVDLPHVVLENQISVDSKEHFNALEAQWLNEGFEGVMLRQAHGLNSKYKYGRATAKSCGLLKVKNFSDAEYKVVGFEERMHNANEATTNALGHTERSSHQENLVPRGDLGALVCEMEDGSRFNCGTGFTDENRREIWENRENYLGKWVKIKSFLIGVKDLPRFPVFIGFRDERDM